MKLWLAVQDQMTSSGIVGSSVLDVNIQTVQSSSLNFFPQMKSPASRMAAISNSVKEWAMLHAKYIHDEDEDKANKSKHERYEKTNKIIEPMAQ